MKLRGRILLGLLFTAACSSVFASEDTVTITTYYPAPYGVYRNLRLSPTTAPTTGVAEGVMFYNISDDYVWFYRGNEPTKGWQPLGVGGFWGENSTTHQINNTNSGGNVGINTNNALCKLHVVGATAADAELDTIRMEGQGEPALLMRSAANGANRNIYNPQIQSRRSRGTLASPAAVVVGDELWEVHSLGYTGSSFYPAANIRFHVDAAPTATSVPGSISFYTAPSGGTLVKRVVIKNDGSVGIGTETPAQRLHVEGIVRANAFHYPSDISLKKNIRPIENPLDKVERLEGVRYEWKQDGRSGIGLIAQDVERVFPELVSTDEGSSLKSMEYANLVAVLIEAVKEQQRQIRRLESDISGLKTRRP
ncbi:MAG: tail fiber domain-containing protein [Candidatus Omnitrophica bacterium]|nr:tail fiber domain-containing protein [Candidatus Omnitrophota bacterium]